MTWTRVAVAVATIAACGGGSVNSDAEAELAYIGLDGAVARSMKLGLQGFSLATSANIDPQSEAGDIGGMLVVTGQADQGSSDNKGLRLKLELIDYTDLADVDDDEQAEVVITFATHLEALPSLDLQLKGIPDGTVDGTLVGSFWMAGDLEGEVALDLAIDGALEPDPDIADGVRRVPGSTTVSGTATGPAGGVYDVDVTL